MTQIEAGQIEGKALGKWTTHYAELMKGATFLYHDTLKGVAKLQNQKIFDTTDNIYEEYCHILDEKKNLKVRATKLIAAWAKIVAESICFVERPNISKIEKYFDTVSILGRFYNTYCKIAYDYDIYNLLENLNDYVDMFESLQKYHERYVEIMNSDLSEASKNAQVFVIITDAIAEFFYKIESQID